VATQEEHKAEVAFNFFDELLGTPCSRSHDIDLHTLQLPTLQLPGLDERFTEQEVLSVTCTMPQDKALGPDGFTARFLNLAWDIIRPDIMRAFDAFGYFDTRSFHLLNSALMILLPKKANAATMRDYRPISLTHFFKGKQQSRPLLCYFINIKGKKQTKQHRNRHSNQQTPPKPQKGKTNLFQQGK
jgi:hypothetical protein